MIGPDAPPSTWPLDHVPTPILDSILPHLLPAPKAVKIQCSVYKLTSDLASLSLVNHDFRHIVLKNLVLHTVVIGGRTEAAQEAMSSIREDSFRYIKHVILLGIRLRTKPRKAIPPRKRFIERCPNLMSLKDETRELGYIMDAALFPTVTALFVHLKKGGALAQPINAPELLELSITADLTNLETPLDAEVSVYSVKVLALCRNIVQLEYLTLQMPGLQVHPLFAIPIGEKVADMLPPTLKSIARLNIQLPYCTLEQGSKREAFAGGYLGWLMTTKPKISHLSFTMTWRPWYLYPLPPNRSGVPRAILKAMGLGRLKYDETRQPKTYTTGKGSLNTLNRGNMQFTCMLFDAHPGLKTVTFRYDMVPSTTQLRDNPSTWFRTATFTRQAGETHERGPVGYNDEIAFEVVDAFIKAQMQ